MLVEEKKKFYRHAMEKIEHKRNVVKRELGPEYKGSKYTGHLLLYPNSLPSCPG